MASNNISVDRLVDESCDVIQKPRVEHITGEEIDHSPVFVGAAGCKSTDATNLQFVNNFERYIDIARKSDVKVTRLESDKSVMQKLQYLSSEGAPCTYPDIQQTKDNRLNYYYAMTSYKFCLVSHCCVDEILDCAQKENIADKDECFDLAKNPPFASCKQRLENLLNK